MVSQPLLLEVHWPQIIVIDAGGAEHGLGGGMPLPVRVIQPFPNKVDVVLCES